MKKEKIRSTPPPLWPETRIASWAELQKAIDPIAQGCVFRGQGSIDWPLISSFNRIVPCTDEALALEWEEHTILRFRSEAHSYLPPTVMPPNYFKLAALDTYLEWLMLMQHYGAPTRLLDWSQSPYVATYFAVIDCRADDAAIWYFESQAVEQVIRAHYGKTPNEYLDYGDLSADEIRRPKDAPLLYTAMKKFRSRTARCVHIQQSPNGESTGRDPANLRRASVRSHRHPSAVEDGILLPARTHERHLGRTLSRRRRSLRFYPRCLAPRSRAKADKSTRSTGGILAGGVTV